MNNRWRKFTKNENASNLFTVTDVTDFDKNFNSVNDYTILSVNKGNYFEYKTLAKRDRSAFKTQSFRKGAKNYATKHRRFNQTC